MLSEYQEAAGLTVTVCNHNHYYDDGNDDDFILIALKLIVLNVTYDLKNIHSRNMYPER